MKRKVVVVVFSFCDSPTLHTLSYEEEDENINDAKAVNNALVELGFYGDHERKAVLSSVSIHREEELKPYDY